MAKKRPKAMSPPTDLYVSKLLGKISEGKRVMSFRKGEKVVSQGAHADAIYFGYRLPSLGGKHTISSPLSRRNSLQS